MSKTFTFADRFVGTIDPLNQDVKAWTSYAEQIFGIPEKKALRNTCYALLRSKNIGPEPACRKLCVAVEHFRADEIFSCPDMDISQTVRDGTQARLLGIPYLDAAGKQTVDFYAWPSKASITVLPSLRVNALGELRLADRHDSPIDTRKWGRRQAEHLLRILIVHRRTPIHREEIMEMLWPGISHKQGWPRLRVILHGLRADLAKSTRVTDLIVRKGEAYRLDPGKVKIDLDTFEEHFVDGRNLERNGLMDEAISAYQAAMSLYKGHVLNDTPHEGYLQEERRRLRHMFEDVRHRMMRLGAVG